MNGTVTYCANVLLKNVTHSPMHELQQT